MAVVYCPTCGHPCEEDDQKVGSCPQCGMPLCENYKIANLTSVTNAVLKDPWVSERIEHYSQLISEMKSALKTSQRIAKSKLTSDDLREKARENVNELEKLITKDSQLIAALELLCDFYFVKELLIIILGRKCDDLEVKAFRIYFLNEEELRQKNQETLILDLFSNENTGISKQEVRNSILERFRTDQEAREYFKKEFEDAMDQFYDLTKYFIESTDVVPELSKEFWPNGPDKSTQFKKMLTWLENKKEHTITKFIIDYRRDAKQLENILLSKKDLFVELFDEWCKLGEPEVDYTDDNCKNEPQSVEIPQMNEKKPSVGKIVLN